MPALLVLVLVKAKDNAFGRVVVCEGNFKTEVRLASVAEAVVEEPEATVVEVDTASIWKGCVLLVGPVTFVTDVTSAVLPS
jgi:hypothetical protein